jgi:hypothetical protein
MNLFCDWLLRSQIAIAMQAAPIAQVSGDVAIANSFSLS